MAPVEIVDQARLAAALKDVLSDGGRCRVDVIETHISYVVVANEFAYKIKKAVDLGFLNFSTLSARRFYCIEELRLNRRLAPSLYLDVVAITGSAEAPVVAGNGRAIEYAVKMRAFDQRALATEMLSRGALSGHHIDALAVRVADFHRTLPRAPVAGAFGSPETILRRALQNFAQLGSLVDDRADASALEELAAWTRDRFATDRGAMAERLAGGFVRECHGDLHLGNIVVLDDEPVIFDCLEFSDEMRRIDVMSDVAFATMDLAYRGRDDLAQRFLNAYLEASDGYTGLRVLQFYLVYRAMVRAKVALLRVRQLGDLDKAEAIEQFRGYLRLAQRYARPSRPAIVITHGFAGSGKSTQTQSLLETLGAIRIRTDVERKRLNGVPTLARSESAIEAGLYAPGATLATYTRALTLARIVVSARLVAIVDGGFLKRWQRDLFHDLAVQMRIPFVIVAFTADDSTLRARISQRLQTGYDASDATLAVLDRQLQTCEPLGPDERIDVVSCDTESARHTANTERLFDAVLHSISRQSAPIVPEPALLPFG